MKLCKVEQRDKDGGVKDKVEGSQKEEKLLPSNHIRDIFILWQNHISVIFYGFQAFIL